MCSFISLALISVRKICNINPTKVLKWEEFTSNRITLVRRPICPLFYCFGSAVNSRFPKAMCIQSLLRKKNNCPSFNYVLVPRLRQFTRSRSGVARHRKLLFLLLHTHRVDVDVF